MAVAMVRSTSASIERTVMKAGPGGALIPTRVRISNTLGALRQERGLTLADVAEGAGVTPMTVWRIENGERAGEDEVHRRLAEFFKLPVGEIFVIEDLSMMDKSVGELADGPHGV